MKYNLLLILSIIELSFSDVFVNEKEYWDYIKQKYLTNKCTAALMGNLYDISGLKSDRYDIAMHPIIGLTDKEYINQVESGEYSSFYFYYDGAGFGIANWSNIEDKMALYEKCTKRIGDFKCQIDFLIKQCKEKNIYKYLQASDDLLDCNNKLAEFVFHSRNYTVIDKRYLYAKKFYNEFVENI